MRSDPLLQVPSGWRCVHHPRPGIASEMTPRSTPRHGLAPVVTLTVADTGLTAPDHLERLVTLVLATFDRAEVEATDLYDFQGADVGYLRFFHRTPRHDMIVEIWVWLLDGRAWLMVASADHRDHPDFTDLFDDIAASFAPPRQGTGQQETGDHGSGHPPAA